MTGGCFLRCYYKHLFVHISSHVLYLSLGYFPGTMYQQGINPEMFLWLFRKFLSLFICKRLKSETQSLKLMPTHACTRTVCLCFLELPSQLKNLISRINLWQNNLESFPGRLYSKSRPSSSVSPNSLVTFLAGHFTPLHFKLKGYLTTLLKQQSFGTSVNFFYDNGRFDFAIALIKVVKHNCFSGALALHGLYWLVHPLKGKTFVYSSWVQWAQWSFIVASFLT